MAKKKIKLVNKNISKQNPPTAGFVEWHDRSQEISDRIAARGVALAKEFKKKNKWASY